MGHKEAENEPGMTETGRCLPGPSEATCHRPIPTQEHRLSFAVPGTQHSSGHLDRHQKVNSPKYKSHVNEIIIKSYVDLESFSLYMHYLSLSSQQLHEVGAMKIYFSLFRIFFYDDVKESQGDSQKDCLENLSFSPREQGCGGS